MAIKSFYFSFIALGSALVLLLLTAPASRAFDPCDEQDRTDYQPINERKPNALLYRVERCGQPVSYLFGTFHTDSSDFFPLLDLLKPRIAQSNQLILEIGQEAQSSDVAKHLMLPASHAGLHSLLPPPIYQRTVKLIGNKLGLSKDKLNRFTPWALALLVQYPAPTSDGIVMDARLHLWANQLSVPVLGLETMEEQFNIFKQLPIKQQITFLHDTLVEFDNLDHQQQTISQHYTQQDIWGIYRYSESLFEEMVTQYPDLGAYIKDRLITKRNALMSDRLIPHLKLATFTAIGALHLPGEDGVLSRLESHGFFINPQATPFTPAK